MCREDQYVSLIMMVGSWNIRWVKRITARCGLLTFQMAEVLVPGALFQTTLGAIAALRPLPAPRC